MKTISKSALHAGVPPLALLAACLVGVHSASSVPAGDRASGAAGGGKRGGKSAQTSPNSKQSHPPL